MFCQDGQAFLENDCVASQDVRNFSSGVRIFYKEGIHRKEDLVP
ncbi:hypothetical protein TREAZ_1019 [Leadbettera azotonutricia ZAS-9]|uniref:Uncharacterized protein n=1 Tax=Leadbettera azotonutricia (strain ATCC BAA-888 / DSM 13862 / ZAS-9) TaxID=545695 RepID=F5Y863_LEAAZ|nr:hypothetical protein TREAZ_1019 [Leadbettera azotonutricia ZAS-9]